MRGLTAKVLNERLKKLLRFGSIDRQMFAEVPPRVEYRLTIFCYGGSSRSLSCGEQQCVL